MTDNDWKTLPDGYDEVGTVSLPLTTVIASVPGVSEQALGAMLQALPSVNIIGSASGCLSALQLVRLKQADVVVIDSNLPFEDVELLLDQLNTEGLHTHALVLASSNVHVRRALAAGAHASLRRDSSSRQLGDVFSAFRRARATRPQSSTEEGILQG